MVEDDQLLGGLLERCGDDGYFEVAEAAGDKLCYQIAVFPDLPGASFYLQEKHRQIAGIWTDCQLQCCSGLDFAREVKRLSPLMPVIMVSGSEVERDVAKESGVDLFVPKPIDLDDIPLISQSFQKIRGFLGGDQRMLGELDLLLTKNRRFRWKLLLCPREDRPQQPYSSLF